MRRMMVSLVGATAVALALTVSGQLVGGALAGGAQCSGSKAAASCTATEKASMGGCTGGARSASADLSCCPIDRAALDRQAPGSRATFETTGNGVALVVTAASAQYVSAVQLAVNTNYESLKAHLTSMKANCSTDKASMTGASCTMSATKASTASSGSSCCMSKGADKAATTEKGVKTETVSAKGSASGACTSSAGGCVDVAKAWCCADMAFEKTANGARIVFSSPKADVVKSLHVAADHMKACPMMAGL